MLVAGGLLDQPAGEWYAMQRAGYIYDLLGRRSKIKNYFEDTSLSASDLQTLKALGR